MAYCRELGLLLAICLTVQVNGQYSKQRQGQQQQGYDNFPEQSSKQREREFSYDQQQQGSKPETSQPGWKFDEGQTQNGKYSTFDKQNGKNNFEQNSRNNYDQNGKLKKPNNYDNFGEDENSKDFVHSGGSKGSDSYKEYTTPKTTTYTSYREKEYGYTTPKTTTYSTWREKEYTTPKTTTYTPPKGGGYKGQHGGNGYDDYKEKTTTKKPWYVRFKNWSGEKFQQVKNKIGRSAGKYYYDDENDY